jgi:hypothetical protein
MIMQNAALSDAGRMAKLLATIGVVALLFGCQTLSFDPRGHVVPEAQRITIPESGERIGAYKTEDLTVAYKMVRAAGRLSVSGEIRFTDRIAENFPLVLYFHLGVILIDAQGKVLDMVGLTSAANYATQYSILPEYPITFTTSVVVPDNVTAVAFNYTGKAMDNAGPEGGSMDFWEYPVY